MFQMLAPQNLSRNSAHETEVRRGLAGEIPATPRL